ncbi:uncharacterized protein LOC108913225 [Anoplophora glabripennis]|uniref:uncharacterized protein LOC108913225 n=1 Tax=Anoplophora glabripennis TaxID=217634 RepID=UPI0008745CF0|nr:uncharacterized protein LOC108913225 [Anoplophora glabripennis]
MEYLKDKFRSLTNVFISRIRESNKEREVSRYEIYLDHTFKILSWENNTLTLVIFLILNFIFWVIVQWQLKFFGVFFFSILLGFLWDTYFETKECTVYRGHYLEVIDDIWCTVYDIILNLKSLRKESPSSFCLGMSMVCLFMSFIAGNISGYVLLYFMILGIFFIPLGFKYLPERYIIDLKEVLKSIGTSKGVLAEEELIPFISNKDFSRKDTDLDSLLTDRTADSVTNSMASGISAMPSYLEVTESQNGIEEDDLLPKNMTQDGISYTPGELSSDSDSDHRAIQFDSAHFNGDSSSEEENVHVKGLRFSADPGEEPHKKTATEVGLSVVLSNFAAVGGTLVSKVLNSAASNAPVVRKNSSDSEFEIIDSEEIEDQ